MRNLVVTLVLAVTSLGGCAAQDDTRVLMTQALQERDAAYVRLANAIGRYCSAANHSPESRQNCLVKNLIALRSEQARKDLSSTLVATTLPPSLEAHDHNQLANVSCARTRFETTCQRIRPAVAETALD